jgi:hypothetical protein
MRLPALLSLSFLLPACGDPCMPTVTADTLLATAEQCPRGDPTSGTTAQPACGNNNDCPAGHQCDGGVTEAAPECTPIECVDDLGCSPGEFCYTSSCIPKRALGEPCPTGAPACLSGACGTVAGEPACVDGCEFRECREGGESDGALCDTTQDGQCEEPCSWYRVPGFTACSQGFLCVTGPVSGVDNQHYCWPEGAGDYGMPGAACKIDTHCSTKNCIYDAAAQIGTCQWSCFGGCPPGQTCKDSFPQNFCE